MATETSDKSEQDITNDSTEWFILYEGTLSSYQQDLPPNTSHEKRYHAETDTWREDRDKPRWISEFVDGRWTLRSDQFLRQYWSTCISISTGTRVEVLLVASAVVPALS
ncbi:uncharacterized protein G2W53_042820 [Senna tora]|uniref:Uncharacterized protein n=1 Tax=Senna tora TaxID=362788 RepID=A0A834SHN1_9FABA|nr:uncharacterized protein G2W53_042820 [Senna tora]